MKTLDKSVLTMPVMFAFIVGAASFSCSEDKKSDNNIEIDDSEVTESAATAARILSLEGCAVDADCAAGRYCFQESCAFECAADDDCPDGDTCDGRGRCLNGEGQASAVESLGDVSVRERPESLQRMLPGKNATISIGLNKALPPEGLAYTVRRSDEEWDGRIHRAEGGDTIEFELPPGAADPSGAADEQLPVDVTISTSVGSFKVALQPALSTAGRYAGSVKMDTFGAVGLPMEFRIVTEPDDAPLEDAEKAWLLLDIKKSNLFSPTEEFEGAPEYAAAELTYNAFVKRWVATFNHEFRLGADSVLNPGKTGQIGRIMRFEVEPLDGDRIVGRVSDRWKGFYDALSADGVVELVDVVFEGDLELARVGIAPLAADLLPPPDVASATPTLIPLPPLDQCAGVTMTLPAVTIDGADYACALASVTAFKQGMDLDRITCAIAHAQTALSGETTGKMIADFLDDTVPNPGDMTFAEFMEKCATNEDGICVPSQEILCARQLTAYAARAQENESADTPLLVNLHQQAAREAYLGRQLAAFKTDADTRLDWLRTSDYPAIVVTAVKNKIADLLQEWQDGVLDVHMEVLGGYMDPSGVAILSRTTTDPDAQDARRQLLTEMVQSWRGTMDALSLATARWDRLFQETDQRAEKTEYVVTQMFDLYLTAGILTNLSRDLGAGYLATSFGSGFSNLMQRLDDLSLSFDKLIFARDAEVVVSTSLDPTNTNATKLSELKDEANAEIGKASEFIATLLAESEEQALEETELRNRMNNEIEDLRSELVDMCGLPVGCNIADFRTDPACAVRTNPGECGFKINSTDGSYADTTTEDYNVSEAGRALLTMQDAGLNVQIASAELRSFNQRAELELSTLNAFAQDVSDWNEARLQGLEELETLINNENLIGAQGLAELQASINATTQTRRNQIAQMQSNIQNWNAIRVSGATTDFGAQLAVSAIRFGAESLRDTGDFAIGMGDAIAESISVDPTGSGKMAAKMGGQTAGFGIRLAANALNFAGDGIENGIELSQNLREARLENLQETAELQGAISEAQIDQIGEQLELNNALREDAISSLHQAYDIAREQRAAELAYGRDMDTLRQRRTEFLQMLQQKAELELRVQRAVLGMQQRIVEYLSVCQSAQLQFGRLMDLDAQRTDVNTLVGSPGVIFARANRLAQAETSLQRAKDKLMNWLVGLEYYAVRPFMDQRIQILLAINAYQLLEIYEELGKIQNNCGGTTNTDRATISVREDLLGAVFPVQDEVSGEELTPEERFRAILEEGFLPIDKRVRYKTDSTVGNLMSSDKKILAGTFNVDLDNFANLASTCNAKVVSIAVQLVGDIGEANPTVTILYDGTSRLRSCQPGITDYIELIGPDLTNFGEITLMRTPGRAISPIAGINEWRDENLANQSLGGLPLASQYTVLIDTTVGENADLDWSKLEDILLDVSYSYSDIFPEGQCQ